MDASGPESAGSVVAARGQQWTPWPESTGSIVATHGLSFSEARGVFPHQGSNLCRPALASGFFTIEPPEKPSMVHLKSNLLAFSTFIILD